MNWRDAPSLAALRGYESAARHRSLSLAASELNVTHAAISQHVRTVENFVGTPLLIREGRGLAPTPAGLAFGPELTEGFTQILSAVQSAVADTHDRPLSISVTPNFAESWLMPRLGGFWSKHPDITLSISPSNDVVDLRRDGFDAAIRYGNGDWPGVDARYLASASHIAVASPSLIGDRKITELSELSDLTWLFEKTHREPLDWARENGLDLDSCNTRELPTLSMVLSGARAAAGAAIVSHTHVDRDIADGRLRKLFDVVGGEADYYSVTRPNFISPDLRRFLRWVHGET